MGKHRLIRPVNRRGAAIWVSGYPGGWTTARHLADCDYFVYEPVVASESQMERLPVCEWCMTRMRESLPPTNRIGPKKKLPLNAS